eukprot:TRINITY_DN30669_c0_g1_i1.p1 TRINITY_DN30669_c0_g1~~TRINITY_DN30669_c0_g1_i1.p1  ORF type:complete len:754 (+),score=350.87 TRINITY_DN30669_c0_g1_i1:173-2434(+)
MVTAPVIERYSRQRPTLSVRHIDFDTNWVVLKEAMDCVLSDPLNNPPKEEIHVYNAIVYKLCQTTTAEDGQTKLEGKLRHFLEECIEQRMLPAVETSATSHEAILGSYLSTWQTFQRGMEYIDAMFYIHDKNAHTRYVGYHLWRNLLYNPVSERLIQALLHLIELDRLGNEVNSALLKGVHQSIVSLKVYEEHFETRFLEATEQFYNKEVAEKLNVPDVDQSQVLPDYMLYVENRLEDEQRRLVRYLDDSTRKKLEKTLVKVTIEAHIEQLLEACLEWFELDRVAEQKRLFKLLEKSDGGLEPLRKIVEDRIDDEGKQAILRTKAEALKDPCVYVESILQVYKKYSLMVADIFQSHEYFDEALNIGCKVFINKNAIATTSGAKSAELLAKYVHMHLKPSSRAAKLRSEEEIEQILRDVLTIFSLLQDKDVFQKVYRDKLSQRLIQGTYNHDLETQMIDKLKNVCEYEFTYKLQQMFTDIGISGELTKGYEAVCDSQRADPNTPRELAEYLPTAPHMGINVLKSVSWPQTAQRTSFTVPRQILLGLENFEAFYRTKYQGRSLQWLHQPSNGVLRTTYIAAKPYELQVSTHQAAVLLCFNDPSVVEQDFQSLTTQTRLAEKELEGTLHVLSRLKVLNTTSSTNIKGAQFTVNDTFHSASRKVALFNTVHKEGHGTDETTTTKVTEDRKYTIQAAIVRIMKTRKQETHTTLVAEVLKQLSSTFVPAQQDVKRNIELLIEKDYIERTSDGKAYIYQA